MFVDVTLNHVRTKSRATNLIKYIFVIISTAVMLPVFANDKHADIMDKIISELYSKKPVIDECYAKVDTGDIKSAFTLCRQAAEQGDAGAQFYLGVMFNIGKGKLKDDKQAVYWFTKAAEQGNAVAQFNLGFMFSGGLGTPKDNVMAYVWWTIAAAQGHEYSLKNRSVVEKK
jgi:TPR repeat protein